MDHGTRLAHDGPDGSADRRSLEHDSYGSLAIAGEEEKGTMTPF